jgi:hypothetical protein
MNACLADIDSRIPALRRRERVLQSLGLSPVELIKRMTKGPNVLHVWGRGVRKRVHIVLRLTLRTW